MLARFESRTVAPGIAMHTCRTPRFKSIALRVRILEPLDDKVAARTLIGALLRRGCNGAPDLMSIARRFENLFGAGVGIGVSRSGEVHVSDFTLRVLHPRFVGASGALGEALDFFHSLITDPVLEAGGFRRAEFDQERLNLERSIRAVQDDHFAWSQREFVSSMFQGEPYARSDYGELADLPALEPHGLHAEHVNRLASAPLGIYAIGGFDDADLATIGAFAGRFAARESATLPAVVVREPDSVRRREVRLSGGESHLFIGFRFDPRGRDLRDALVQAIAATLLGGGSSSLLFREVREREGLCYATHAQVDRLKGFVLLYAGIDAGAAAARKAEATMLAQVARLAQGDFEDDAFAAARAAVLHAIDTVFDSPFAAVDFAARAIAAGWRPDRTEFRTIAESVVAADVERVANDWRLDLIFLARGGDDAPTE